MRFYFHVSNCLVTAEDHEGVELPSFIAALEEGGKIAEELMADPDTMDFQGGVVNIVGDSGLLFVSLPITKSGTIAAGALN